MAQSLRTSEPLFFAPAWKFFALREFLPAPLPEGPQNLRHFCSFSAHFYGLRTTKSPLFCSWFGRQNALSPMNNKFASNA